MIHHNRTSPTVSQELCGSSFIIFPFSIVLVDVVVVVTIAAVFSSLLFLLVVRVLLRLFFFHILIIHLYHGVSFHNSIVFVIGLFTRK